MKKLICLLLAIILCMSVAAPVLAAEFVPSIPEKDITLVPGKDDKGDPVNGVIRDKEGKVIDYIYEECLVVTPVSQAETSTEIPADSSRLLLQVYEKLSSGEMSLPYDKFPGNLDPNTMVIRDLIDISWPCEDHPALLASGDYVLEVTFDLGVDANTKVYVMTYKNNEWNPIYNVRNNGDGTVTFQFEHLCPVAFSVSNSSSNPAQTGDTTNITPWIVLMAVSVVAMGALAVVLKKNAKRSAK